MNVAEITPEKRPDLFYLPRDDNGTTVYDVEAEEIPDFLPQNCIHKRVKGGRAAMVWHDDRLDFWYQPDGGDRTRVATTRLTAEVWAGGAWQSRAFQFEAADLSKPQPFTYRALIQRNVSGIDVIFGQQIQFKRGSAKQTFYLDAPDRLVRLKWQIRTFGDEENLSWSVEDYAGASDYEETG